MDGATLASTSAKYLKLRALFSPPFPRSVPSGVWVEPCAQDRREKTRARSENNAESRTPGRVCVCGENYAGPPDPFFSFKLVFLATERIPGRGGTHSSRQVCMRHSTVLVSKLMTIINSVFRATNLWTPFRITMVPDKLSCYEAHLK